MRSRGVGHDAPALVAAVGLATLAACAVPPTERVEHGPGLEEYKSTHYAAVPAAYEGPADFAALDDELRRAHILVLGDEHTDRELHSGLLTLLDHVLARCRSVVLLVEFLGYEDRNAIAAWSAGRIGLVELREAVRRRWPESWLEQDDFDGPFYRDVLTRARAAGAQVLPLEPIPRLPLGRRDLVMAGSILRVRAIEPETTVIVLVGHAHLLGADHLLSRLGGARSETLALLPWAGPLRRAEIEAHIGTPWPDAPFLRLTSRIWLRNPGAPERLGRDYLPDGDAGGFALRGVTGAGAGTARRGRAQGTWTSSPLSVSRQRTITE